MNKKLISDFREIKFLLHVDTVLLTHGGGEDDDAKDVHLLAAAGTRLVHDLRGGGQLQVHHPTFRVTLVGEDVDEVRR